MEQRLQRAEEAIARHDSQISTLFSKVDDVNKHLACIQNTLNQIKWMALGGLGYVLIQEVGVIQAFKVVV